MCITNTISRNVYISSAPSHPQYSGQDRARGLSASTVGVRRKDPRWETCYYVFTPEEGLFVLLPHGKEDPHCHPCVFHLSTISTHYLAMTSWANRAGPSLLKETGKKA